MSDPKREQFQIKERYSINAQTLADKIFRRDNGGVNVSIELEGPVSLGLQLYPEAREYLKRVSGGKENVDAEKLVGILNKHLHVGDSPESGDRMWARAKTDGNNIDIEVHNDFKWDQIGRQEANQENLKKFPDIKERKPPFITEKITKEEFYRLLRGTIDDRDLRKSNVPEDRWLTLTKALVEEHHFGFTSYQHPDKKDFVIVRKNGERGPFPMRYGVPDHYDEPDTHFITNDPHYFLYNEELRDNI